MTTKNEEIVGKKIGEDAHSEHWSLDGHSYVEVPKWITAQILREVLAAKDAEIEEAVKAEREEWYLGKEVRVPGDEQVYIVVAVSSMIYDKDCEGEPEWKITDNVQEVAIAVKRDGVSYQKPRWIRLEALTPPTNQ